jgi:hypothetical protein
MWIVAAFAAVLGLNAAVKFGPRLLASVPFFKTGTTTPAVKKVVLGESPVARLSAKVTDLQMDLTQSGFEAAVPYCGRINAVVFQQAEEAGIAVVGLVDLIEYAKANRPDAVADLCRALPKLAGAPAAETSPSMV